MGTGGTYNNYDQIILPCWGVDPTTNGSSNAKTTTELADLVTYGDNGGHFFATHYSYAWLYNNSPYSTTAGELGRQQEHESINSMTGTVSQSVPPTVPVTTPGVFVEWLNFIQALSNATATPPPPNPAHVTIANARHDVDGVLLQSTDWIDGTDPGNSGQMLLHYTFDTAPIGQTAAVWSRDLQRLPRHELHDRAGTCEKNSDCSSNSCAGTGTCNLQPRLHQQQLRRQHRQLRRHVCGRHLPGRGQPRNVLQRDADDSPGEDPRVHDLGSVFLRPGPADVDVHAQDVRGLPDEPLRTAGRRVRWAHQRLQPCARPARSAAAGASRVSARPSTRERARP